MWGHKATFITNSMMLVAKQIFSLSPEGALKSSDGGGRPGDVENARLDHSTFAVWRPAIQDPVILTEFIHKTCLRHYVCFELICLICVSCLRISVHFVSVLIMSVFLYFCFDYQLCLFIFFLFLLCLLSRERERIPPELWEACRRGLKGWGSPRNAPGLCENIIFWKV